MAASVEELMAMGLGAELAKRVGHVKYAGDPSNQIVPHCVGAECHDTQNNDWYVAVTVLSSGWKISAT